MSPALLDCELHWKHSSAYVAPALDFAQVSVRQEEFRTPAVSKEQQVAGPIRRLQGGYDWLVGALGHPIQSDHIGEQVAAQLLAAMSEPVSVVAWHEEVLPLHRF